MLSNQSEVVDSVRMATKFLMNVTVERSFGPIHLMISPESTVMDLVQMALNLYVKEGRRPLLQFTDPTGFELHYSLYNFDCLDPEEKLKNLGSRNFFLCARSTKRILPAWSCRSGNN
ncbi:uncharacterized protein At4g22758-like [Phalaenopsis equestris]|uniref:uncharacterized protein At4g22758-like n=1 Tax=Phalaenopsis equestris TaxID=78828 RepID=UPI0009E507B7|nr:uncharacterized protein At4g22758-like [Phalaenopsis equestris]